MTPTDWLVYGGWCGRREALPYQNTASLVFTGVFGVEFLFKILAQGPVRYLSESWNLLDVAVLIQVSGWVGRRRQQGTRKG